MLTSSRSKLHRDARLMFTSITLQDITKTGRDSRPDREILDPVSNASRTARHSVTDYEAVDSTPLSMSIIFSCTMLRPVHRVYLESRTIYES